MRATERGRAGAIPCPEATLARAASRLLACLAVPLIGGAWIAAGPGGALGAGAGMAFVLALFGLSGLALTLVSDHSPSTVVAVSVGGVFVRLLAYPVALALLAPVQGLHRPSLAAATAVAFVATLAYEVYVVSRTPRLYWLHPGPRLIRTGACES